jgi:hypothetical protein
VLEFVTVSNCSGPTGLWASAEKTYFRVASSNFLDNPTDNVFWLDDENVGRASVEWCYFFRNKGVLLNGRSGSLYSLRSCLFDGEVPSGSLFPSPWDNIADPDRTALLICHLRTYVCIPDRCPTSLFTRSQGYSESQLFSASRTSSLVCSATPPRSASASSSFSTPLRPRFHLRFAIGLFFFPLAIELASIRL